MTESEKAAFVLAMLMNEQMMIPAPLAKKLAECQEWLELMANPKPSEGIQPDGVKRE